MILLSTEECKCLCEIIDELSGSNAENVFCWDGPNDWRHPRTSATAKIFFEAGRDIPRELREAYDL